MRRLALIPALLVTVLVALPAGARPLVETFPVEFSLSSAECSNLAAGTTLAGSGIQKSITTVRTNASGITTIMNVSHAHGTSTDQDGNVYVFNYSNEFRGSNTVANPTLFTGLMTDHFSNSGSGPAKLNNGFVANITFTPDFSTFSAVPISSHGDPFNFPSGPNLCDPL
jgi:hypothetical protein